MAHARLAGSAAICGLLAAGCGASDATPSPPPAASAIAPPAPRPQPPLALGPWGTFRSERFGLTIPLPDGRAWRIDDRTGTWLSATHDATSSTLAVRAWRGSGIASRRRCEEEARVRRKIPDLTGADIVEQRAVNAPAGFDTYVEVAILAPRPDPPARKLAALAAADAGAPPAPAEAPIDAFILAFGGRAHRCFGYIYTTQASGPDAERALGERLATMVERSLGAVVLESDLDPHIPRAPHPER